MIKFTHKGSFSKTERFLNNARKMQLRGLLESYGQKGVEALSQSTPKDTGLTASSWEYEVIQTPRGYRIVWSNSHVVDGVPIAIILQYGHGTGSGGYVEGRDYINPVMRPLFDELVTKLEEEVSKL